MSSTYHRLKPSDMTIYGDLRMIRVKSRLFRPFLKGMSSESFESFFAHLIPKCLLLCDSGIEELVLYNVYFRSNLNQSIRSYVLPFYSAENGSTFVLHLIKMQRRIRARLGRIREERRLALCMGLHWRLGGNSGVLGMGGDCVWKILEFC